MKTIKKLTSFIGAVAFATVITMVITTQSQAHGSHAHKKSHGSQCHKDSHGSHAHKKSHGSQCHKDSHGSHAHKKSHGSQCHKDSHGSHAHKKSHGSSCHKGSHDHKGSHGSKGSHDSSCQTPTTGNVYGTVFEDKNENNTFDTGEGAVNITVNITDTEGTVTPVKTDENGSYYAKDILAGTVTVKVDEDTLPTGAQLVVGEDPEFDLQVTAGEDNYLGEDGYVTPLPTGNICGTVYYDLSKNDLQEPNEKGVAGLIVKLTDANGDVQIKTTVLKGNYCFYDIVTGAATVEILTLPTDTHFSAGDNPNVITILANENNFAGKVAYQLDSIVTAP